MSNAATNKQFFKNFTPIIVRDKPIGGHSTNSTEIITLSINATGTRVVCSRTDKSIRIWKSYPDKILEPIIIEDAHSRSVEKISWNPKTEYSFATVGRDEYVKIWRGQSGSLEKSVKVEGDLVSLKYIKYLIDGDILIVVDRNSHLYLLSVEDNYKLVADIQLPGHMYDLVWLNLNHDYFFCGLNDGTAPIYKVNSFDNEFKIELIHTLTGHQSSITSLCVDPRGSYLAAGSNEGVVSFWDLSTMLNYQVLTKVDESIACIDSSRDGTYIACTYDGGSNIKIFDQESLELVFEIPNSLSGEMTFSNIAWFPHKTAFAFTSDYCTTLTVMKKSESDFKRRDK